MGKMKEVSYYEMPCVIYYPEGSDKYLKKMQEIKAELFRSKLETFTKEELIQLRKMIEEMR